MGSEVLAPISKAGVGTGSYLVYDAAYRKIASGRAGHGLAGDLHEFQLTPRGTAFLSIYRNRVADLLRIATGGSGVLPQGELHPDLVNRLASEAAKSAGHVLQMCIRALDYCPPVDITFGDYLRAMVTADRDFGSDESMFHSVALVEAFRRRGIYPREVRTLSVDEPEPPAR